MLLIYGKVTPKTQRAPLLLWFCLISAGYPNMVISAFIPISQSDESLLNVWVKPAQILVPDFG